MKSFHVLLIDDDLDEFEFFLMALEKMPSFFKCTYAASGLEGVRLLAEFTPDFIFVDMNMPRWDGLKCIEEIKRTPEFSAIPVVLYSTSVDENLEKQAKKLGVINCIKKPMTPEVLGEMLRKLANIDGDFIEA